MLIMTRYLGPTNTKGARIKAYRANTPSASVIIPYPYESGSYEIRHRQAAKAFADKLNLRLWDCVDYHPQGFYFIAGK